MRKPSVLVILLTVFIDLIGFGIIVPFIPSYSEHLGAQGFVIGLIFAAYSATQFVFSPIWGRLSDRYGRRPILLLSTAGASLSYVLFARATGLQNHTTALWLIVISRLFAGMCGGNIAVAQAYIADITPAKDRSKRMGLIGMAFGLGFILGPFIGSESMLHFGDTGPGWVAAGMCATNFILAWFILTESHRPDSAQAAPRPHLDQWLHTLRQPKVGFLIIVFFFTTFCFSCFESTLPLLVGSNYHMDFKRDPTAASPIGYLYVYCGLISALVQGGAIGRLVKRLGEPKLIALSLVLTAASFAWLPFLKGSAPLSWKVLVHPAGMPWVWLLAALTLLAIGTGLTRPPLFGLISNLAPTQEQGATIGVAQGTGSLARIVGPIFATGLLAWSPPLPYLICAGVLLGTTILVVQRLCGERPLVPAAGDAAGMAK